jgi:P2-related tail formation protein
MHYSHKDKSAAQHKIQQLLANSATSATVQFNAVGVQFKHVATQTPYQHTAAVTRQQSLNHSNRSPVSTKALLTGKYTAVYGWSLALAITVTSKTSVLLVGSHVITSISLPAPECY